MDIKINLESIILGAIVGALIMLVFVYIVKGMFPKLVC